MSVGLCFSTGWSAHCPAKHLPVQPPGMPSKINEDERDLRARVLWHISVGLYPWLLKKYHLREGDSHQIVGRESPRTREIKDFAQYSLR